MYSEIKFGTDGWRALIARDFTFDNVQACAQGVAEYVAALNLREKGVLVGYDTRFASEDFAAASAEVLAANGIKVYLCPQAVPTQVDSFGVRSLGAAAGIIITASHNGHQWNGFKIKNGEGASAATETIEEVEGYIHKLK
ncbi:MAG: phosphoglucomutase/phosphomannomutase family protein, partial [Dehalococcoidia bacterium]|nr:phosphoglucomutase/phosphomannomutase family protein [Dehalococcoidia bacterium]